MRVVENNSRCQQRWSGPSVEAMEKALKRSLRQKSTAQHYTKLLCNDIHVEGH
jgi:hypothetical protein